MKNKILPFIIVISGILGLIFAFVPVLEQILYIDALIFVLSICAFGLMETTKRKKHLFSVLIILVAIIFIVGLVSALMGN